MREEFPGGRLLCLRRRRCRRLPWIYAVYHRKAQSSGIRPSGRVKAEDSGVRESGSRVMQAGAAQHRALAKPAPSSLRREPP